jgi:hypothetical protein
MKISDASTTPRHPAAICRPPRMARSTSTRTTQIRRASADERSPSEAIRKRLSSGVGEVAGADTSFPHQLDELSGFVFGEA